jgi:DNA-binding transcriptional LysR family regulator
MPQSFHQTTVWRDSFSCLMSTDNKLCGELTLEGYLESKHIWVSKTGFGVGVGVNPEDVQRLGWVDEALGNINCKRDISIFTRHYQVAMQLAQQGDLIATLPSRAAELQLSNPKVVVKAPPFDIPEFELKLAWSPLLHHNAGHRWLRRLIVNAGQESQSFNNSLYK